jgi:predicted PurR-regulated permease PerM
VNTDSPPSSDRQPSGETPFPQGFLARWLLVLLFAVGIYFFHGFIVPVLAALVISVATWPLYKRLMSLLGNRRTLAATIAILVAIIFIVVPLGYMTSFAIKEVTIWLAWAVEANNTGAEVPAWIRSLPYSGEWLAQQWDRYIGQPGMIGELTQVIGGPNIGTLYRNVIATSGSVLHILLTLVFILITLFFIYRDGTTFTGQLDRVGESFYPGRWHRYSRIIPVAISSTVVGMGVIAIGEGIILGTAYWIAGVPSPVMLGILTGFMALIPGGAPLCFTLVSVYLMASNAVMAGVLLFIWGCTELFIVDKFLRPRLVGRPMQLPFLPTFFGLIGGVKTMGVLGLFIGPALMAVLVTIWREFMQEQR